MTNKYRMIQVGTGGQGNGWCSRFLPPNIADGRIEPVAAVDVNHDVLINAQQHLGLPPEKCYTDIERKPSTKTLPTSVPLSSPPPSTNPSSMSPSPTTCTSSRKSRLPIRLKVPFASPPK